MGGRQRVWAKLCENVPQKLIFYIIFAIFHAASKLVTYTICQIVENVIKSSAPFGLIEVI